MIAWSRLWDEAFSVVTPVSLILRDVAAARENLISEAMLGRV